jgi:hypothetical protein
MKMMRRSCSRAEAGRPQGVSLLFPCHLLALSPCLLVLVLSAAQGADFVLRTASGESRTGPLEGIEDQWSVRLGGDKPVHVAGGEVVSLRRAGASLHPFPVDEQVMFTNGDRLPGQILELSGERLRFRAALGEGQELNLPLTTLAVLWVAAPDSADDPRLARRLLTGQRRRDAVWLRNGDVLEGVLTGLDRRAVQIEVEHKGVRVDFAKVAAIALNTELARRSPPRGVQGHLVLANGSRLTLVEGALTAGTLSGRTPFGVDIRVPLDQIVALDLRQGRAVYLSDLKPVRYQFTSYFEGQWPWVPDGSASGDDLVLAGSTYDKGLGLHSESRITYDLAAGYRRFEALVGLDDKSGREGRVRLQVLVDGKARDLDGDQELRWEDGPRAVAVDVTGARELTLVVRFGRRGNVQGHVDWADARLLK